MKNLLLRLDLTQFDENQIDAIKQFFSQFYESISILDIDEQRRKIEDLKLNTNSIVVSMDKFIPLEHNIDVSRVFDLEGNYLYHRIMYNGKQLRDVPVVLYDHDKIGGYGLNLAKAILQANNCPTSHFVFVELSEEQSKTTEILDLADFVDSGLVCEVEKDTIKRVLYTENEYILEKLASIASQDYTRFCEGLSGLKQYLNIQG